jgi:malate synthase
LIDEEYAKLLNADNKDVYDASKITTLPIAREIAEIYVFNEFKIPWFIDLLNINLNNQDLGEARKRIADYIETFKKEGKRITENPDFIV